MAVCAGDSEFADASRDAQLRAAFWAFYYFVGSQLLHPLCAALYFEPYWPPVFDEFIIFRPAAVNIA